MLPGRDSPMAIMPVDAESARARAGPVKLIWMTETICGIISAAIPCTARAATSTAAEGASARPGGGDPP